MRRGVGLFSIPLRYKENFSPGSWYKCCLLKHGHNLVGLLAGRSDYDRGRGNKGVRSISFFLNSTDQENRNIVAEMSP